MSAETPSFDDQYAIFYDLGIVGDQKFISDFNTSGKSCFTILGENHSIVCSDRLGTHVLLYQMVNKILAEPQNRHSKQLADWAFSGQLEPSRHDVDHCQKIDKTIHRLVFTFKEVFFCINTAGSVTDIHRKAIDMIDLYFGEPDIRTKLINPGVKILLPHGCARSRATTCGLALRLTERQPPHKDGTYTVSIRFTIAKVEYLEEFEHKTLADPVVVEWLADFARKLN